ncbi:hypothetical protein [Flaviflexus huanghaiensis]|uniref:hypothetical protein n=1 Tax=Flaviflexus huanghaiensis TaxID=1111473 RepID=UPI0015FC7664|nr:hypothetical protein [Flaviflexus huanghaiensis]
MSIRVEAGRFASVSQTFDSGVLIAHHPRNGIRVLTVDPEFDENGNAQIFAVGQSVFEALVASHSATIVWQPNVKHGWTLIYDGRLDPRSPRLEDGATEKDAVTLTMVSGMLHRPSSHADGPDWQWPES